MKINKKKFLYLISPNKILKSFYGDLIKVLKSNKVSFFQLRLKKDNHKDKLKIAKKIKKICQKYKVKLLINDDPLLAKRIDADGCHLGQKDMNIKDARNLLKKKIIGITCHNSLKLAKIAIRSNPDYLAFGAFNASKTKKVKFKANVNLIKKLKKTSNIPVVAIGGINNQNYKNLLLNKSDFLAISGYIWNNKKLKPLEAIRLLK
ncbi:thiamine phosphate synthase [Pelagibacterales bacterium SAG-MED43]|nr:thiamine phosphate synthase [Pelagibacterales bacterium SAG-MED43]